MTFESGVVAFATRFISARSFELIVAPALADLEFEDSIGRRGRLASRRQHRMTGSDIPFHGAPRPGVNIGFARCQEAEFQRGTGAGETGNRKALQIVIRRRIAMAAAAKGAGRLDAAERLADLVVKVAGI